MPMAHGETAPQTAGKVIRWAFWYDMLVGTLLLGKERHIRRLTADLANLQPGDRILDVGCGTGTLTIEARRRVGAAGSARGIDAAPEMVARARRKAAAAGVDVAFQVAAVERLPYPDGQFDVVLSSLMLHHLPPQLRRPAFAEIRRVLKPGGRLLVVDFQQPQRAAGRTLTSMLLGHDMGQYNLSDNLPFLPEVGFVQVEHGQAGHALLSYLRANAQ